MFSRSEHVGIMVRDIERSMAFYGDVLGLELLERRTFGTVELAFFSVGDLQLELIAGADPSGSGDSVMNHFAFRVDNVEDALSYLKSKHVPLDTEEPKDIWNGGKVVFFRGPDGERLELFQRGKG